MRFFNRLQAKRQTKHGLKIARSLLSPQQHHQSSTPTAVPTVNAESYEYHFEPKEFHPYLLSGSGLSWPAKFLFVVALILVATPEALAQASPSREDKKSVPNTDLNAKKNVKTYHGIPATDVSDLRLACTPKQEGKGHEGKVCVMDGKHHLKKPKNPNSHELLKQQFNSLFVKAHIDIVTPEGGFVHENGVFYLATKHVAGFTPGTTLLCFADCNDVQFRQKAVDVIREKGIVKLMVAHTFIDDLHGENWGYDANNNLVIVDLDHSPKTAMEHYSLAIEKLQLTRHKYKHDHKFKHVGYPLTLNNVKAMREVYQHMLEQPLPIYHQTTDLTLETYKEVLNVYIKACDNLFERLIQKQPDYDLNAPNYEINRQLAQTVEAIVTPRRTPAPKSTTTKPETKQQVKTAPVAAQQQAKPTPPPHDEAWEREVELDTLSLINEKALPKQLYEKTTGRTDNWKIVWTENFFHYLDLIADLIIANVIKDYQGLYNGLVKIGFFGNGGIVSTVSGLCCLSGEVTAVEYAIQNGLTGEEVEGNWRLTPLHLAVLSGSVPVIEQVLALPNTDPLKLCGALYSALIYAIKSGSLPIVKKIAAIPGMLEVSKRALFEAAIEGFIEAIIYLRQLGLDPKNEIYSGKNIFDHEHYWDGAAVETIRKALTDPLPVPELTQAPSLRS